MEIRDAALLCKHMYEAPSKQSNYERDGAGDSGILGCQPSFWTKWNSAKVLYSVNERNVVTRKGCLDIFEIFKR